MSLPFNNYYELFGLKPSFSVSDLRKGFQQLVKIYHPDKNLDKDTTDIFQQIRKAYEIMGDEEQKTVYDKAFKAELLRKEKAAGMDKKRSRLKAELDEAERKHKIRKMEEQQRRYASEVYVSKESQDAYEKSLLEQTTVDLRKRLNGKRATFAHDFIVLKWKETTSTYSKEDISGIFSGFGIVAVIEEVTNHSCVLVFKKEDGAIKLMHSAQSGKQFGITTNRITVEWADQKSQVHFATENGDAFSKNVPRPRNSKEKSFTTPSTISLEEHLELEREVLNLLLMQGATKK